MLFIINTANSVITKEYQIPSILKKILRSKTAGIRIKALLKIDIIIPCFAFDMELKNAEDTILIPANK